MDAAFGNWLAGFIDGEGCFDIVRTVCEGRASYRCRFTLVLREDDRPILDAIKAELRIGAIHRRPAARAHWMPSVAWRVSTKTDCLVLRQLLRDFPLRAKKARDFALWSLALDESFARRRGASWQRMSAYKMALSALKQHGGEPIGLDEPTTPVQLHLISH